MTYIVCSVLNTKESKTNLSFQWIEWSDKLSNGVCIARIYAKERKQILEYYDDSNFNCKNGAKKIC